MSFVVCKFLLGAVLNNVQCVYGPFATMDAAEKYARQCTQSSMGSSLNYLYTVELFQPPREFT